MLRLKGSEYSGRTISELLSCIGADQVHAKLLTRPYFVIFNGDIVLNTDYEKVIIADNDFITVMPFMGGGQTKAGAKLTES